MGKSSYKLVIAGVLAAVFMVGCKNTREAKENNIKFDSITVDKTYHLLEQPANPNCNLQIKFIYPVSYANKDVLEAIRKQFVSAYFGELYENLAPEEAVKQYTDHYIEDYKSLEDDYKEEISKSNDAPIASWFSYYEMSSNEILYNKNNILSYAVSYEGYTGGAHGAHSRLNYVLDLKTGNVITEEDIFIEDFHDAVAQMLVDKIAGQNQVANPKELENIGFFSIDEIFPNGNFVVDDTGITYYFNEYEIAAYVVGITHVHLPYSEIGGLLRKDSPIAALISN